MTHSPMRPARRRLLRAACLVFLPAVGAHTVASAHPEPRTLSSASEPAPRITPLALAGLFPASLGAWTLDQLYEPDRHAGVPVPFTAVHAVYKQGPHRAQITVTASAPADTAAGARHVYREARSAEGEALVVITLSNGLAFAATSRSLDLIALEALLRQLDLRRAEALRR